MAFIGLIGAAAVATLARSCPLFRPRSSPVIMAVGVTAVASSIAATGYLIAQYPAAALHLHPGAGDLPRHHPGRRPVARHGPTPCPDRRPVGAHVAAGVALVLGLGLLQSSPADVRGSASGIYGHVFSWPILATFVTGVVVSAVRRSIWAGIRATVWIVLLASLRFFAIAVAESVRWYRAGASLILAGDAVLLDAVGENLRNFTWFLILFPFFWTPFGVIGAAIGRAGGPRLSRAG